MSSFVSQNSRYLDLRLQSLKLLRHRSHQLEVDFTGTVLSSLVRGDFLGRNSEEMKSSQETSSLRTRR